MLPPPTPTTPTSHYLYTTNQGSDFHFGEEREGELPPGHTVDSKQVITAYPTLVNIVVTTAELLQLFSHR